MAAYNIFIYLFKYNYKIHSEINLNSKTYEILKIQDHITQNIITHSQYQQNPKNFFAENMSKDTSSGNFT